MNLILFMLIPIIFGWISATFYITLSSLEHYKCFKEVYIKISTMEFYRYTNCIMSTDESILITTDSKEPVFVLKDKYLLSNCLFISLLNPIQYYWYRKYKKIFKKLLE